MSGLGRGQEEVRNGPENKYQWKGKAAPATTAEQMSAGRNISNLHLFHGGFM